MKKTLVTLIAVATLLTFNACKKAEDATPGATGPQGPQGNANVTSQTFTTANASWVMQPGNYDYMVSLYVPAVNQDLIDKGTVNVFAEGTPGTWVALPFTYFSTFGNPGFILTPGMKLDSVLVDYAFVDGTTPNNPGVWTFKVVTIAGKSLAAHPNVNLKDYNSIKREFDLK